VSMSPLLNTLATYHRIISLFFSSIVGMIASAIQLMPSDWEKHQREK
jgi:hypothetical protein